MKEWIDFSKKSNEMTIERQESFEKINNLKSYDKYVLDLEHGCIFFIRNKKIESWSNIQVVGKIDKEESLWLWSYSDNDIPLNSKDRMQEVMNIGLSNNFEALQNNYWKATEEDGLQMSSIVLNVLSAESLYKVTTEEDDIYLVLEDFNLTEKEKSKLKLRF